jgi:hypothetical protein
MTSAQRAAKAYEDRMRDIERVQHRVKMEEADKRLDEHAKRNESARRLYEERVADKR